MNARLFRCVAMSAALAVVSCKPGEKKLEERDNLPERHTPTKLEQKFKARVEGNPLPPEIPPWERKGKPTPPPPPPGIPPVEVDPLPTFGAGVSDAGTRETVAKAAPERPLWSWVQVGDFVEYDTGTSNSSRFDPTHGGYGNPRHGARVRMQAVSVANGAITVALRASNPELAPRWLADGVSVTFASGEGPPTDDDAAPKDSSLVTREVGGRSYRCWSAKEDQREADGPLVERCTRSPDRELILGAGLVGTTVESSGFGGVFFGTSSTLVSAGRSKVEGPAPALAFADGDSVAILDNTANPPELKVLRFSARGGVVTTQVESYHPTLTGGMVDLTLDNQKWESRGSQSRHQTLLAWVTSQLADPLLEASAHPASAAGKPYKLGRFSIPTRTGNWTGPAHELLERNSVRVETRWQVAADPAALVGAPMWIRYGALSHSTKIGKVSTTRRVIEFSSGK